MARFREKRPRLIEHDQWQSVWLAFAINLSQAATRDLSFLIRGRRVLGDFLQVLALPQATPAGGSACAHVGAVGIALFLKVLRLEAKRSTAASHSSPDWDGLLNIARRLLDTMQKLISEDADAYEAYRKALKDPGALPRDVNDAVGRMTECPIQIIETAVEGIVAIDVVFAICSQHLKPDLAVCCELLTASWQGARHIAEANLPLMPDQERRLQTEHRLRAFLTAARQAGSCHINSLA